jgi:hypothetical protein
MSFTTGNAKHDDASQDQAAGHAFVAGAEHILTDRDADQPLGDRG